MTLTIDALSAIAGGAINRLNAESQIAGIRAFRVGLERPHRLAHFLAQVMHESQCFAADVEKWGPTAAQKRYEGKKSLGNTDPGDGYRFRGRGPIQITGRANYAEFRDWCRACIDPAAPNFETDPDLALHPPWEGLTSIWFWATRPLGEIADAEKEPEGGRVAAITKIVNGGKTGLADRERIFARAALHLLGYPPDDVKAFQREAGLRIDGIAGPLTREALHRALAEIKPEPIMPASLEELVAILDTHFGSVDWRRPA